jgi:hypothetical protein
MTFTIGLPLCLVSYFNQEWFLVFCFSGIFGYTGSSPAFNLDNGPRGAFY